MTLCSSHPQQADFGTWPSFQATARFVTKIRDADRWTQKENESASTSSLLTQLGRLLMSSSTLFPFLLGISSATSSSSVSLHASLPTAFSSSSSSCFLPSIPLHHAPSVSVSLSRSFPMYALHFYDSPVSPRQINPEKCIIKQVLFNLQLCREWKTIIKDS